MLHVLLEQNFLEQATESEVKVSHKTTQSKKERTSRITIENFTCLTGSSFEAS
jgi:hypothetical protein